VKLQKVQSSNVGAVGYEDGVLLVRFNSGTLYRYSGVPADVFSRLLAAPSKGAFVATQIVKSRAYQVEKIDPKDVASLVEE